MPPQRIAPKASSGTRKVAQRRAKKVESSTAAVADEDLGEKSQSELSRKDNLTDNPPTQGVPVLPPARNSSSPLHASTSLRVADISTASQKRKATELEPKKNFKDDGSSLDSSRHSVSSKKLRYDDGTDFSIPLEQFRIFTIDEIDTSRWRAVSATTGLTIFGPAFIDGEAVYSYYISLPADERIAARSSQLGVQFEGAMSWPTELMKEGQEVELDISWDEMGNESNDMNMADGI